MNALDRLSAERNGCVLTLNAGSSSLKVALYASDDATPCIRGMADRIGDAGVLKLYRADGQPLAVTDARLDTHEAAFGTLIDVLRAASPGLRLDAVGHRVVHGGQRYDKPLVLDDDAMDYLSTLVPFAPLHQPHNLRGIRAAMAAFAHVPQVACFDTSFHRSHPWVNDAFALPRALYDEGVRRYGFHGLSYEYVSGLLAHEAPQLWAGKVVVAHLGNGASMCAVQNGRSVASTMGFSALDGLPMGTRCGAIDPGVMLWLMDERGLDARAIEKLIYSQSGLLGVSGVSSDMRTLLASDDPRARLAVDLYVYRIGRELGSLAAALGGLDALVFTGGIGEHAAPIRERVCALAAWLGVVLDREANGAGAPRIGASGSRVSVSVIPTNEELMIARHTWELLNRD